MLSLTMSLGEMETFGALGGRKRRGHSMVVRPAFSQVNSRPKAEADVKEQKQMKRKAGSCER